MDSCNLEISLVETAQQREAVFAVRMLVFVEEQAVPAEEELDAYDLTAAHFYAKHSDATATSDIGSADGIVATARLIDKGHGIAKIGRVAVLKEYRGLGLGFALMLHVEKYAASAGYNEAILEAQMHALAFYQKLGYVEEGEIFLDAGIEHKLMRKSL